MGDGSAGRIGFLFNHDQIHQVAHSLPIALALADGGFGGSIVVATTSDRIEAEVRRIGGARIGTRIEHVALRPSARSRAAAALLGSLVPAARLLIYGDHLSFFRSLDALVVAEKTSLILKQRHGLTGLRMIHTRHGAGDRAIGFDRASAGFDQILCSGPKIRRRLIAEAGVDPARIDIVGYPKFDLIDRASVHRPFPADRETVLYNPHPSPRLSSWFRDGRHVLEAFAADPRRALLFAPHVMLFERPVVVTIAPPAIARPGRIPRPLADRENILIDLGSRASTDMSHVLGSDVYLGDASSQVYEFLLDPRPCIFLNSHRVRWEGDENYLHWTAGEVIEEVAALGPALDRAHERHRKHYRTVQERLFADSFDLNEKPSAVRAADAIVRAWDGATGH